MEMLIRRQHLPLCIRVGIGSPRSRLEILDALAWYGVQSGSADGMAEEGDGVPWAGVRLARNSGGGLLTAAEHNTVDSTAEEAVSPIAQEVANVDEDGRRGVGLGPCRFNRDRGPGILSGEDLKPGLACEAEEEGN